MNEGDFMIKTFFLAILCWSTTLYAAGSKKSPKAFKTGSLVIVMTVDWEGRSIEEKNLQAMRSFNKKYPGVPVLHFLNAAYYTKKDANSLEITKKIKSVLRPHDEHGLHVHAWKRLIEASGVKFRTKPDLGGWSLRNCDYDCGHAISIEAYEVEELKKIFNKSIQILTKNGFKRPRSFRSGAWQTGPNVARALSETGFKMDSSATTPNFVSKSWGINSLLVRTIKNYHPNITLTSQPFPIRGTTNPLWQVPNNGSLADYTTAKDIMRTLKANVDDLVQSPKPSQYVVIGFHQETAMLNLPRIEKAIENIISYASKKGVPVQFAQLPLSFAR